MYFEKLILLKSNLHVSTAIPSQQLDSIFSDIAEVLEHVKSCDIRHGVMSDHKMVIINLNLHDNKRGAGY